MSSRTAPSRTCSPRGTRVERLCALVLAVAVAGCREDGGPAPVPASIAVATAAAVTAEVGTALATPPSFVVRDAGGNALGGIAVSVSVGEGGGTLRNAPTRTAAGATAVGQWTLGTSAGRNTLVVRAGDLPAFTLEATALPGPPSALRVVSGNSQVALAGEEVPAPLQVAVVDRFGNGVPGQSVRFEPLLGGGRAAPSTVVTGSDGVAGGVRWELGPARSSQTLRASILPLAAEFSAQARSDFTIDVRFAGTPPVQLVQDAFLAAAERLRTAIIGDLPDLPVQNLDVSRCGGGAGATLTETIDDIVIFASVSPIDGAGRVLGRAGACYIRTSSLQTLVGQMQFDDADLQAMLATGRFDSVVLHEMLHVIGIGSLWRVRDLVEGSGTGDPRYTGAIALDRCGIVGFALECATTVPLENTGGAGTAEAHWRESVFDRELMTGFAETTADMPLSVLTLGSLADMTFVVNERAADPFRSVAARVGPRAPAQPLAGWDEVLEPLGEVTPFGLAQPLRALPVPRRPPSRPGASPRSRGRSPGLPPATPPGGR